MIFGKLAYLFNPLIIVAFSFIVQTIPSVPNQCNAFHAFNQQPLFTYLKQVRLFFLEILTRTLKFLKGILSEFGV